MVDNLSDILTFWKWAMQDLARASADIRHPGRWMSLATLTKNGPEQRLLVLRDYDALARKLTFFTDGRSHKVTQVRETPATSLLFFNRKKMLQIRLSGRTTIVQSGARWQQLWEQLPKERRVEYQSIVGPGQPTKSVTSLDSVAHYFTILDVVVDKVDLLHLGRDAHRRAVFEWSATEWVGEWVQA